MIDQHIPTKKPDGQAGEKKPTRNDGNPRSDETIRELALSGLSLGEIAAQMAREAPAFPDLQMPHLDMTTAIRFRWALRDIKGKRTKLMPVRPDDLRMLIEMGLIEMRDDVPVLTNEGERAIDRR